VFEDDLHDESNKQKYNDGEHYTLRLVPPLFLFLLDASTASTTETPDSKEHAADDHNDSEHHTEHGTDCQTDVVE